MSDHDAYVTEIRELHAFFVSWYRAACDASNANFARFADVLDPAFEIVGPNGHIHDRERILTMVRESHGSHRGDEPPFSIEIRNAREREIGSDRAIVVYEEWQSRKGESRGRLSTAVLARDEQAGPNGVRWLHVHECWTE